MATNAKTQGYLIDLNTLLTLGMEVWPVHVELKDKSEQRPYPRYTGSARLDGADDGRTLYQAWISKGYRPCVLKVKGMLAQRHHTVDEAGKEIPGDLHKIVFPDTVYIAALVNYTTQELRIITRPAGEKLTSRYVWTREPVKVEGADWAERWKKVLDLVNSTKPARQAPASKPARIAADETLEAADPFAA